VKRVILLAIAILSHWCFAAGGKIELIYPRISAPDSVYHYNNAMDSTFLLGHVNGTGDLYIDDQKISLWSNGAFLARLKLIKSSSPQFWSLRYFTDNHLKDSILFPYDIQDSKAENSSETVLNPAKIIIVKEPHARTLTMIGGGFHLFPEIGCKFIAGKYSNPFYEINLSPIWTEYIDTKYVNLTSDTLLPIIVIKNGVCASTSSKSVCSFNISECPAWQSELSPDRRAIELKLFRTKAAIDRIQYEATDPMIENITWSQQAEGVELQICCRKNISKGYEISFDNDSISVTIKNVRTKKESLKKKIIVIDPGHGGTAVGAIGPMGTQEKDVTLRWSQILRQELVDAGATVIVTRSSDSTLDLYQRCDIAKQAKADFFISLHANALPDDENPLEKHGIGTYYYQSLSRHAAEIMQKHLLKETGLINDGLYDANLAVLRPTGIPSVLIEGAYLIYPPEEELLCSEKFLDTMSKGIVSALREYFRGGF
jgi:N-acetylmuramoyl-L-alanine amidase